MGEIAAKGGRERREESEVNLMGDYESSLTQPQMQRTAVIIAEAHFPLIAAQTTFKFALINTHKTNVSRTDLG